MSRVSVVIPVYNSSKTIEKVLQSVVDQTAITEILEVIVIDDGSVDSSAEIINSFIKSHSNVNIIYVKKENGGVSSARNLGMRTARGEFIAFLDSDDLWLPNKIERQLEIMDAAPDIFFLGTAYLLGQDKKEVKLKLPGKNIDTLYKASLTDIYWKHFPTTPSVIFRREAIDKVGYFNEQQKYGEDINYFQRFCIELNYYYLPECLVHVAHNKSFYGSEGLSSNFKGMHQGGLQNLRELKDNGDFSFSQYALFRIYFELKYWRRLLLRFIDRIIH